MKNKVSLRTISDYPPYSTKIINFCKNDGHVLNKMFFFLYFFIPKWWMNKMFVNRINICNIVVIKQKILLHHMVYSSRRESDSCVSYFFISISYYYIFILSECRNTSCYYTEKNIRKLPLPM